MADRPSFNLVTEPWISVQTLQGKRKEVGLLDLLANAGEYAGIYDDSRQGEVSIYRMVIALLHAACQGPRTPGAWAEMFEAGRFDMNQIKAYLDRHADRFDLFHPTHPFMQACDPVTAGSTVYSVNTMISGRAHGNNATLFSHHVDNPWGLQTGVTPARAAVHLLAVQNYGACGTGQVINGKRDHYTRGLLTNGIVVLPVGGNLFETLVLGMVLHNSERPVPWSEETDRPLWERGEEAQGYEGERVPGGYLELLTWPSRNVLLNLPDEEGLVRGVRIRQGWRTPNGVELPVDPMMACRRFSSSKMGPVQMKASRSGWRDLDSLAFFAREWTENSPAEYRPALVMNLGARIAALQDPVFPCGVMTWGILAEKAKTIDERRSFFPVDPKRWNDEAFLAETREAIRFAEEQGRKLEKVFATTIRKVYQARGKLDLKRTRDIRKAIIDTVVFRYWNSLEEPFWNLFLCEAPEGEDEPENRLDRWLGIVTGTCIRETKNMKPYFGTSAQGFQAMGLCLNGLAQRRKSACSKQVA
jgi:CRISPR type I-E-associated protein CasA/Cse1